MFARATTLQGSPDRADEAIEQYRTVLSTFGEISGNRGAFLLVDRSSGKGIGVTLWESEEAMAESRERANQLRRQAVEDVDATIQSVEEFEVAVWEVRS